MLGYLGAAILLFAYILLITKESNWFVPINLVASILLTGHAFLIHDKAFILVNAFVSLVLIIKFIQLLSAGKFSSLRNR